MKNATGGMERDDPSSPFGTLEFLQSCYETEIKYWRIA